MSSPRTDLCWKGHALYTTCYLQRRTLRLPIIFAVSFDTAFSSADKLKDRGIASAPDKTVFYNLGNVDLVGGGTARVFATLWTRIPNDFDVTCSFQLLECNGFIPRDHMKAVFNAINEARRTGQGPKPRDLLPPIAPR